MFPLFTLVILIFQANAQKCLNHQGNQVHWLLLLHLPASVSQGYLYTDSLADSSNFSNFSSRPDASDHPISRTLSQINFLPNLGYIAWNDQNPNGSTTSVRAHSKHVVVFKKETKEGIVIVHSMPRYPSLVDGVVNMTISDSQRIYGQHFFCFQVSGSTMEQILQKAITARPNIYASNVALPQPVTTSSLFQYSDFTVGKHPFKVIYKNGRINGSIFEDGLTLMLSDSILAETWGRPYQLPWCGSDQNTNQVGNIAFIQYSGDLAWKNTMDHSKWAITTRNDVFFSCMGDMNRMSSQWKRGGMFYCIQSQPLRDALKGLILIQETCIS